MASYTVTYKAVVDICVSVEVDNPSDAIQAAEDVLGGGDLPAFLAKDSELERSSEVSVGRQFDFLSNEPTVEKEEDI